jgi:hypothetical protein
MTNEHQSQPATGVFGEGISLYDLAALLKVIRIRGLTLQVKITDRPWENLSLAVINQMTTAISSGVIKGSSDIRLRLFANNHSTE